MLVLPHSGLTASEAAKLSLFDALVRAGEQMSFVELPSLLHGFLVERLNHRMKDPDIVSPVLALELLNFDGAVGEERNTRLERTGDGALLLAGLFPERAQRLHVSRTYFRHMGVSAYANLAAQLHAGGKRHRAEIYETVANAFMLLELVLKGARKKKHELTWKEFMEQQRFLMGTER